MLEKRPTPSELSYYVSPLLEATGVPHAFSTRGGGVSPSPFNSLNLGISVGESVKDSAEHVHENYRRLMEAIGCANRDRCWVTQVHGSVACVVRKGQAFEVGPCADALICNDPSRLISVKYADCVPILLASTDGRSVAAVHAGWRGVIAGVLPETVRQLAPFAATTNLVAAIGPCIGEAAFEVGEEVLAEFKHCFGNAAPIRQTSGGKGHVDLREAVRLQLISTGIDAAQIDTTDCCTFRDAEFFSHRRDQGITGRMAAIIGPRAAGGGTA